MALPAKVRLLLIMRRSETSPITTTAVRRRRTNHCHEMVKHVGGTLQHPPPPNLLQP